MESDSARSSLVRTARLCVSFLALAWTAPAQYTIRTIAGAGPADGVPATSIAIGAANCAAVDAAGNLYIPGGNRLFKVTNGLIYTVAGDGTYGSGGDGGPAVKAQLASPSCAAVDNAGIIYIADAGNAKIRRISNGIITTFAGDGTLGSAGDGGPATRAQFNWPRYIAVDGSGNLYITDSGNLTVRKVSNGIISRVAGTGDFASAPDGTSAIDAPLHYPGGLATDGAGNLYVAEYYSYKIRKISNGILSTVAGNGSPGFGGDGGPATAAQLNAPAAVAVDASGNLYIADMKNERIRKVSGGVITTVAGDGAHGSGGDGGPATKAQLSWPVGLTVDAAGSLYLVSNWQSGDFKVRKISNGVITTVAGDGAYNSGGDGGPAVLSQLNAPRGIAIGANGDVYVSEEGGNFIRKVSGGIITTIAGTGAAGAIGDAGPATAAELYQPAGIALDSSGDLYVADAHNFEVRKISNGVITRVAGTGIDGYSGDGGPATGARLFYPSAVAVAKSGDLYIADTGNGRVRRVSNGVITTVAGTGDRNIDAGDGGPAVAAFIVPLDLAFDDAGSLYIADLNRMRKISGGIITTVAGTGQEGSDGDGGPATSARVSPCAIAFDRSGSLYIADCYNHRIRKVTNGIITTLAGTGVPGLSGDGGAAAIAQLNRPSGIAVDGAGTVYVADTSNYRVRVLAPPSFQASPSALAFRYLSGARIPDRQTITLGSGASPLAFTATNSESWISIAPAAGATPASLAVSVSPGSLGAGTYSGSITIAGGLSDNPLTLPVTLTVSSCFSINPPTAVFPATGGSGVFNVAALDTTCTWTAASDSSWLTVVSTAGDAVSYSVAANTGQARRTGTVRVANLAFTVVQDGISVPPAASRFTPVPPCRIADTRNSNGPFGGPKLAAGQTRDFAIPASICGIPATASAYALNVTAVPQGRLGYLTLWPTGQRQPFVSTLNSDGRIKANAAIVPAGAGGSVSVYVTDAAHVVLDINGYFSPAGTMAFYPLAPCRVADTRNPGGTSMGMGEARSFPIAGNPCGIPAAAQAYSLNFTVVPREPLGFLTVWPAGQAQPFVSTLNALGSEIVANAAILPAGNGGAINVYTTGRTDVIIDTNGYFAAAPGGLSLYPLQPCRVADTRTAGGPMLPSTARTISVAASGCAVPAAAQAYSLNVTAVPLGALGYLALWPSGAPQPLVSTLNSVDGAIVSNAAIAPAGGGAVNALGTGKADVILDINGYFAP